MEDVEFEKLIKEKGLVSIVPENVGPRVWYKNLHRYTENMIAGEIAYIDDRNKEVCVDNAEVLLTKDGEVVAKTRTSTFGEFCFDPVAPSSGEYEISADIHDRGIVSVKVVMEEKSIDIGLLRPGMDPVPSHDNWDPERD